MEELNQEAVDSAIILENKIKERVEREVALVLNSMLRKAVTEEVKKAMSDEKHSLMMEIVIAVGKAIRNAELEERKPLWESTPEEFGLSREDLTRHMMNQGDKNAIYKDTPPVQERVRRVSGQT